MLEVGEKAPDFELKNQHGESAKLYDLLSKGPVVLYFYPKNETRGCTAEACSFRDSYEEFKEAGAEVIGVSADTAESHGRFAENHQLPFVLLSDPDKIIHDRYRVPKTLFILPGRVTYVIAQDGKILMAFNSMWKPEAHVKEALAKLA